MRDVDPVDALVWRIGREPVTPLRSIRTSHLLLLGVVIKQKFTTPCMQSITLSWGSWILRMSPCNAIIGSFAV